MNLPKPTIVEIPKDKQEAAQELLDSKSTRLTKLTKLNYITGRCSCGKVPTKILKYDVSDDDGEGTFIERYCDSCFERWVEKRV